MDISHKAMIYSVLKDCGQWPCERKQSKDDFKGLRTESMITGWNHSDMDCHQDET